MSARTPSPPAPHQARWFYGQGVAGDTGRLCRLILKVPQNTKEMRRQDGSGEARLLTRDPDQSLAPLGAPQRRHRCQDGAMQRMAPFGGGQPPRNEASR